MLSYRVEGSGPPLVLIHGWGITYDIWRNLAPLLKPHFKLIMIELPGMGESSLPDPGRSYYTACAEAIEALRLALGIERWSVISYSAGTRVGEVYVQCAALHVHRAVFLCPAYLSRWRSLGLRFFVRLDKRWPRMGDWMLSDWRLYRLIWLLGFNGRYHPYVLDWTKAISTQPLLSLKTTLRELPGRRPFALPGSLSLFVWGRYDLIVTRPRRLRGNNQIIRAGHSAPVLAAPAVAETILSFLR